MMERRESADDLTKGKEHLLELFNRAILLAHMDEKNNGLAIQLVKDLYKVNSALELKQKYEEKRKELEGIIERGVVGVKQPEDMEAISRILHEMADFSGELV